MQRPSKADLNRYTLVDLTEHRLDVAELSLLERGVYEALRLVSIERAQGLPNDLSALCRLVGATNKQERAAVASILAKRFQPAQDGLCHNERCDTEIARIAEKRQAARANGTAGAAAKWGFTNDGSRQANAMANRWHEGNEGMKELDNKNNKEHQQTLRTQLQHKETADSKVPKNLSAPPKDSEQVGASVVSNDTPFLPQLTDESPTETPLLSLHQLERLRCRRINDPDFAAMPPDMQARTITDPNFAMGGLALTPAERDSDECRRFARVVDGL